MINKSKVVSFVATKDSVTAKEFYGQTLGLEFVSEDDFAIVFDANGIMLRVQKVEAHQPLAYTVLGWEVTDINSEISELISKGVTCERYPWLEQDESGIWTAPGGAKIAWFKDPDGNLLSLTQF